MFLDFVMIKAQSEKKYTTDIFPEFLVKKSKDLMIRGKSFYAVWDEEAGFWSRNEDDIQRMVDRMTREFADEYETADRKNVKLLSNFSSRLWQQWQQYCKSLPDNYHELDEKVIFANTKVNKTDYVSRCLPYEMYEGECSAYDEMMSTLYEPSERQKLEWAIGAVIAGDSKMIQKFVVLYGGPGTGKSTVLNIIQELFPGYYSVFDSKALASSNNAFALEAFSSNPLVAIEHDGDLSKIEDNTKLNSIVSHEMMVVNEKFKSTYASRFNSFIFMGTNKPVRITDAKSGIIRRLIDVKPSGVKIPVKRFEELRTQISFELGAIAARCLDVYKSLGPSHYDGYLPLDMMASTNVFYNFMEDNYDFFANENPDGISLNVAWLRYKEYCNDANVTYPYTKMLFKDELKNYFERYQDRTRKDRYWYSGFIKSKFDYQPLEPDPYYVSEDPSEVDESWLQFNSEESVFDELFADCPAQYANEKGTPTTKWEETKTKLGDLDTHKLHYVQVPETVVTIDFDLKDDDGNKSLERNIEAASQWPQTYAELSQSGEAIHLEYFYDGDVKKLSRVYDIDIEIKVAVGNSSLRRKLSKCNDLPIATISSGLPMKGGKTVVSDETIKNERHLRAMIAKALRKQVHASTKPNVDYIYKVLEDAYGQGLHYDVRDMAPDIQAFANNSSHQAEYCVRLVNRMRFVSDDEPVENTESYEDNRPIVFYDVEVFPNLFIICWKQQGKGHHVVKMINPTPAEVKDLTKMKLVGFNNRKYDNHILYARMMGYNEEQLYKLSQKIIAENNRDALFVNAYNLSYTDIYDFLSSANKMSLKKWEIKLGIHHQELGLPWDKPVPKELWMKVAEYCCNDVVATEACWDANQADWLAREILADLAELTVNDTTNQCTTKIIVGNDRNPQSQYIYTDLSTIFPGYEFSEFGIDKSRYNEGTKIVAGKSLYRGEDPGEGGYVYAEPGMHHNVALLDVASMHPHSLIRLNLFGEYYTMRFKDIVDARIYIKHKEFDKARSMLDGKLAKYLDDPSQAKKLANALKTAINSVYGLTSAKFPNKLRDPRNKDNIVAKYGALFMINLKHEVQKRGYTVVHIKTDSIKIANADTKIIEFVNEYGREYGYTFEHEATYAKMCIVNDAVYIAQYDLAENCKLRYGYVPADCEEKGGKWTATGTQFQVPYVFKTLFSKEKIEFEDLCETKSVSTALYLDLNERLGPDEHDYRFVGRVGAFCPIKPGCGGGVLLREINAEEGKFAAATGTKKPGKVEKGEPDIYYWLESEVVKQLGKEKDIDLSHYNQMVDDAIETISQYGDFEKFANGSIEEDMSWLNVPEGVDEEIPFAECMNPPVAA